MFNWNEFLPYCGTVSELQQVQLIKYMKLLQEENKKYNLTTIIADEDVFYKHFLDSVLFAQEMPINEQAIVDIGTGAGFPGMVIKILFPNTKVTLVESNAKKTNFLNLVIAQLGLKDIQTNNTRAEEFSVNFKEKYDLVISRAMAPLNVLLEIGVQAIKIGGYFVCLKAKNITNEFLDLNGKEREIALKLELEQKVTIDQIGSRVNLFFKKTNSTNSNYPRLYSQIKKKPLGK